MNVLIAGGAGFLGSNLSAALLAAGYEVCVVDNLLTGNTANMTDFKKNKNFTFFELGVETSEFVDVFLNNDNFVFDQVYALACPTGVPNIQILGEEMMDACSIGTKNILNVARKHDAQFLLTSTSEVYGDPQVFPQSESYHGNVDPQGPRANYEEAKRFAETLTALYAAKYGVDVKTVRLFNVYGPYMSLKDQRVMPRFIQQALRGEALRVHDTNAFRTMCYVEDIVVGLRLVMERGEKGGIYNIGSDREIRMQDLAEKIIAITKSTSGIDFVPGPAHDHKRRMPDLSRIRNLGWTYRKTLDEGIRLTVADFKNRMPR